MQLLFEEIVKQYKHLISRDMKNLWQSIFLNCYNFTQQIL